MLFINIFEKYDALILDELLKRKKEKTIDVKELYFQNFEINKTSDFGNKYISRKLTLENLPNVISSTNPEELFDKLVEMLKERNSEIQKIDNKNVREKEEEEYKKLLTFLQRKFPEKYNKVSQILTKNLNIIRLKDTSVRPSNPKTIFPGLNLRSENYINHSEKHSTRHNYLLSGSTKVYAKGNYDLQFRKEFYLDDYYIRSFIYQIEGCGCEFIFNKYFCFYECYYSVNGEPEKSTDGNVVNFMVVPGLKIKERSFETFNFVVDGKNIFQLIFQLIKQL